MNINLNVKIKGGKRTPVSVDVYSTSMNEKEIEFANGKTISEFAIAKWIQEELSRALKNIQEDKDERA